MLKRLRLHGLIEHVSHSYRYRLTELGQRVVSATLRLRAQEVVPALAGF